MNVAGFVQAFVGAVVVLIVAITAGAYMQLIERRLVARFQLRRGPNRVGPLGLLQPLADVVKILFKGELTPLGADRVVYRIAPIISVTLALPGWRSSPLAPISLSAATACHWFSPMSMSSLLILLAFSSLGVYGIVLGGWGSGSKYSLLGSLRSAAQIISYELPLGLSLASVLLLSGTTRLTGIVAAQSPGPVHCRAPCCLRDLSHQCRCRGQPCPIRFAGSGN